VTLSELVEEFLIHSRDRRRVAPGTLLGYRAAFDPVFGPAAPLAGLTPGELTAALLDDAYGRVSKERRWKTRTLHGKLASCRAFVRWLGLRGHVPRELVEEIELPRFTRRPPDVLSQDEVRLLFDGVEVLFKRAYEAVGRREQAVELRLRRHAMLGLLVFGGLRAGEVVRLERRQLAQRTDGRMMMQVPPSKHGATRTVPLDPQLVYALTAYYEHRADRNHPRVLCSAPRPGQDAPRDRYEARELAREDVTQEVKLCGEETMPGRKVNANLLRHTCATMLADVGVTIFELMGFFGWRSLQTALQYIPVGRPVVEKVDRAFKKLVTPFGFMVGATGKRE
jgi:site-specific recombinase XerD